MFYVKNPHFSEFENYLFFLDYVYKKIPEYASANNYSNDKDFYKKLFKRFTPKLLCFYHEGKVIYQSIPKDISFVQFVKNINYSFIYRPNYNPNAYRSRFYTFHGGVDFREPMKFIKNKSNINKKEFSEKDLYKKEWRKYKGFQKDQSKNKNFDKPNKKFKMNKNRCFRHKQNQLIREQKFDEIYDNQIFLYYNLWDWI